MKKEYKVLIHTKNALLTASLATLCEGTDYVVVPLHDVSNLVLSVYDEMPHVVLVDLRRANVGGFETCKQLKTDAVLEHIPLVVLTDLAPELELPDSGADRLMSRDEPASLIWEQLRDIVENSAHALDVHPLTHLPGTRSSVEKIEDIIQKDEPFAICAIHLRKLNLYYRTFGPQRGDSLIRRTLDLVTELCGRSASGRGFIGHLGDRDFVLTLPPDKSVEFAERLIEQFELRLGGVSAGADGSRTEGIVTMTVAIVTNEKQSCRHISEVVRTIEQMHRFLKRYPHSVYLKDRRNGTRDLLTPTSFNISASKQPDRPSADAKKITHPASSLLNAVTAALYSGRVEAHYQPIVDWSGAVRAHEALSRFPAPDGSWLDPMRTFQTAREADLIRELDVACAINVLRCASNLPPNSKLFVNLNRETLLDPHCLEEIFENGFFDTRRIVVEITEQSLVRRSAQLRCVREELDTKGIQLALDDAGGGSVSLREAAELKPHYIKFDKSIIRDIHSSDAKRKIVLSLSVFAKSMSAMTVAEGIETEPEWNYLRGAGVDWGQGYLIAKPQASPLMSVPTRP